MRPRIGRQIAGVCVGLSQAYGWDVGIVRVVTVLGFCFSGGLVGIAYLAGWIGIPDEPFPLPGPMSGAYPPTPGNYPTSPAANPPSPGTYPPSA